MIPLGILASSIRQVLGLLPPENLRAEIVEVDPHWDNVVFLSHFDATPFVDEAGSAISAVGAVTLNTDIKKFGAGSAQFSGGHISIPYSVALDRFKNVNSWTIEGFFYIPSSRSGDWSSGLFSLKGMSGLPAGCHIQRDQGTDYIYVYRQGEATAYWVDIGDLTRDAMHYFTLVSVGSGAPSVYINGNPLTLAPIEYGSRPSPPSAGLYLGFAQNAGWGWVGSLDEWRVTVGVARYTEYFDPPTEPFPNFGPPPEPLPEVIGEPFGGGFYAGDIESDGQWYKLIVADISADITGENSRWKTTNTSTAGTAHLTDGAANTNAMIAAGIELHPAAAHCTEWVGGGYEDWYMPAKDELNVVYLNLGYSRPDCPPDFLPGGPQAFSDAWYWASTQHSSDSGWMQRFSNGSQGSSYGKYGTDRRVRPVRRLQFNP